MNSARRRPRRGGGLCPGRLWLARRGLRTRPWRALSLVLVITTPATAVTAASADVLDARPSPGSVVLLLACLLTCGLAVAHATLASAGAWALELRQQAVLGLLPGEILGNLLAGVALPALAAGLLGTLLAGPVAAASHLRVTWHPLLAVPVAVGVSVAAAFVPAWHASIAAHADRPPSRPWRWRPHARGRFRAAIVQLSSTPGRSGLCLAAFTVAGGVLTVRFLVGAGDRGAGPALIGSTVLTAVSVVADAGWCAVRDRGGELADLRVQGLSGVQIAGLVLRELVVPAALGAGLGGAFGLVVAMMCGSGRIW